MENQQTSEIEVVRQLVAALIAQDGLEGWNFAQATDYDLILLDLMLPRLDGVSLYKQLRAAGSTNPG
ncbi:response regulator [Trichothermofontia sichuanensis B231]|uniref:response regulator n=1 Tax=Trichothermofontia sichuanensis TaxID=3045816 RepID=UPI002247C7E4|nr:response regulator [Trichothermofontia sichuanensis B231]